MDDLRTHAFLIAPVCHCDCTVSERYLFLDLIGFDVHDKSWLFLDGMFLLALCYNSGFKKNDNTTRFYVSVEKI